MTAQPFDAVAFAQKYGAKIGPWANAERCERDLATFYKEMWQIVDPSPFMSSWILDAVADHLMAVTDGQINNLLINLPFRTGKTLMCCVAWIAWTWAQRKRKPRAGPQVRFMALSYASDLAIKSALTTKRVVESQWYQERWGDICQIAKDRESVADFDTTAMGGRVSLGFDGGSIGRGGDIKIIDDPHKVQGAESDDVRTNALQFYDEALSSRFTNPTTSAEVVIMQRLHQNDLSGHIIDKYYSSFTHLMIPMLYDPERHCHTVLGWDDPRGCDKRGHLLPGLTPDRKLIPRSPLAARAGTLMWPKRFPQYVVDDLMRRLGPYAAAGQLQQEPTPRGGGIIRPEWWRLWPDEAFPDFRFVLVSVDTASTEKEQNDESGITVWGIFEGEKGQPQVMLCDAWEGRLEISRLVQKIAEMARKRGGCDVVLIEAKANGIDVANEIRRIYGQREWMTIGFDPKGDKMARLLSVQPVFSGEYRVINPTAPAIEHQRAWTDGMVWAPNKDWAQITIDRVAAFPKGKQKALVDTTSQGIWYLRNSGYVLTREEHTADVEEEMAFHPMARPRYDV